MGNMLGEVTGIITDSVDGNVSKLQETVKDRGAWRAAIHGVTKSQTEQQHLIVYMYHTLFYPFVC